MLEACWGKGGGRWRGQALEGGRRVLEGGKGEGGARGRKGGLGVLEGGMKGGGAGDGRSPGRGGGGSTCQLLSTARQAALTDMLWGGAVSCLSVGTTIEIAKRFLDIEQWRLFQQRELHNLLNEIARVTSRVITVSKIYQLMLLSNYVLWYLINKKLKRNIKTK